MSRLRLPLVTPGEIESMREIYRRACDDEAMALKSLRRQQNNYALAVRTSENLRKLLARTENRSL